MHSAKREMGTQASVTQTDVETELTLVTSAPIANSVRRQLGAVPAATAAEVGQTNVIAITATSTSPVEAARVANAYARDFVAYREATASQKWNSW